MTCVGWMWAGHSDWYGMDFGAHTQVAWRLKKNVSVVQTVRKTSATGCIRAKKNRFGSLWPQSEHSPRVLAWALAWIVVFLSLGDGWWRRHCGLLGSFLLEQKVKVQLTSGSADLNHFQLLLVVPPHVLFCLFCKDFWSFVGFAAQSGQLASFDRSGTGRSVYGWTVPNLLQPQFHLEFWALLKQILLPHITHILSQETSSINRDLTRTGK